LEIDLAHRPVGCTQYATFHPTFLYETVWFVAVARRNYRDGERDDARPVRVVEG
jgi:hypothetical protein